MEELLFRMLAFRFLLLGTLKLFLHSCIENALHFNKQKNLSLEKENCICQVKKFRKFSKLIETCVETLVT